MRVHLLDGTYELFRHHYGRRAAAARTGAAATGTAGATAATGATAAIGAQTEAGEARDGGDDVAGTRGVLWSVLNLLAEGATYLGVATDHVIESFRNEMWPGYKSSAGVPEDLLAQFGLLEESLAALGVVVWPMVDLEADDALAAAAEAAAGDGSVDQVVIMTPDKDLAQCVRGTRVVQLDRRKGEVTDQAGVRTRYGVDPESIPDWLALVGDSSDGYPGLKGWGKQAASTVLRRYRHIEDIPEHHWRWDVDVRGKPALAATLAADHELALLFRDLATLRTGPEVVGELATEALRWTGPTDAFTDTAAILRAPGLAEKAHQLADRLAS